MKKRIAVFLAALMLLSLCGCKSKAAKETDELILKIGEVTASSTDEVERAQSAYDALSDKEKTQVENYAVLEQAQKDLAEAKRARAISEFEKFAKNTPYKAKEGGSLFEVDTELVEKYIEKAADLREMGVTDEECPALLYADMVAEIGEYAKYADAELIVILLYSKVLTALQYEADSYSATTESVKLIQKAIDELDAGIAAVDGAIDMNAYGVKTLMDAVQELHDKYETLHDAYSDYYLGNDVTALLGLIASGTVDASKVGVSEEAMAILSEVSAKSNEIVELDKKLDEKHAELFG
jgi:lipoprotein